MTVKLKTTETPLFFMTLNEITEANRFRGRRQLPGTGPAVVNLVSFRLIVMERVQVTPPSLR